MGRVIQALCLFIFIILFNKNVWLLFHLKDKKLFRCILCSVIALFITSVLSASIDMSYLRALNVNPIKDTYTPSSYTLGIMLSVVVFIYFTFIEYLNRINKTEYLGKVFFKLCLFYCIVADIVSIVVGVDNNTFIGGGKFGLSYLHLFLVVFYYMRNILTNRRVPNINYYGYILYAMIVSIYTECTTSLIGCVVLFCAFKYKKVFSQSFFKPKIMLCVLMFCALFPLLASSLINNSLVSYIIVDVLGEDLTLTGRTGIFETLGEVLFLRPIWGFGLGNGHYIMAYLYGTANAQNGVANLILEQGIVGLIAVVVLWLKCMNEVRRRNNLNTVFSVYAIILVLVVMSMVEITMDTRFVVFTSFLLVKNNANQIVSNSTNLNIKR